MLDSERTATGCDCGGVGVCPACHRAVIGQALNALDGAHGCLELVADDIKPIDLHDCRQEVDAARTALAELLGMHDG